VDQKKCYTSKKTKNTHRRTKKRGSTHVTRYGNLHRGLNLWQIVHHSDQKLFQKRQQQLPKCQQNQQIESAILWILIVYIRSIFNTLNRLKAVCSKEQRSSGTLNCDRSSSVALFFISSELRVSAINRMLSMSTLHNTNPHLNHFYAWQQNASHVIAIVKMSIRLSVTLRYCVKMVRARLTKFLLWVAPRMTKYDKILCPWVQGFPSNKSIKEGQPLKDVILPLLARIVWKQLQIGIDMLRIITSTGHGLFSFIHIDDLEWPWTPKRVVFSEFFASFGCSAHLKSELRWNAWRQTKITCTWNFQH